MGGKILFSIFLILLVVPLVFAGNYDASNYNKGVYGVGEVSVTPPSGGRSSGGSSSNATTTPTSECSQNSDCEERKYCFEDTCFDAQCLDDSVCNVESGESCWNYQCVKLFDMEILEFASPIKVGEFFDFTYFLKAVAEINGDVEIKFWIEQDGSIITSGQDTIYFSSFEEKTKTKKLFLSNDISSGTYVFYIQVTYGTYTASAHRTIGIEIEEGFATIRMSPDSNKYIIYGLIGLSIFIVFLIFYLERRKIRAGIIKEGRWIKKHRVSILVFSLFIILGILAYYLQWFELILFSSINSFFANAISWLKVNVMSYLSSYGYPILGGIIVFIFIIGVIVLFKKKFKKKKKIGTHIKYKKRFKKDLKKILD